MHSTTAFAFAFAACLAQAWAGPYNYQKDYSSAAGEWNTWGPKSYGTQQASAQGQVAASTVTVTMTETTTMTMNMADTKTETMTTTITAAQAVGGGSTVTETTTMMITMAETKTETMTTTITAAQACSGGATVTAYVTNYVTASPPASILALLASCLGSAAPPMETGYSVGMAAGAAGSLGASTFPIDASAPPSYTSMLNNFVPGLSSIPATQVLTIHEVVTASAAAAVATSMVSSSMGYY